MNLLFNQAERKGIVVLFVLITLFIVVPRKIWSENNDLFLLSPPIEIAADSNRQHRQTRQIELNTADSTELVRLRGIGPYYAARIIRYRERLGGFYSIRQLKELKMKYFDVDSNAHLFTVNPNRIRKKDLDTMSFKAILRHPYLEYQDVQMIFNAKRKYQHITFDTLKDKSILPPYVLKKIKPYFK